MPCILDVKRSREEIVKAKIDYSKILKEKKSFIVDGNKYFLL